MKNIINSSKAWIRYTALGVLVLSFFVACEPEPYPLETTDVVNMTEYLQQNPEQFSKFSQILDLSGNADYLGTYGAYTLFAPTNDAIDAYLNEKNMGGVKDLDVAEIKNLVKFHLIKDTLKTTSFTDGKLPQPTWYGQYITTGAENVNGVTRIRVNRQANLVEGNIRVGNGYIHSIDAVLEPASLSLVEILESNPDYSIFVSALKATGYYDSLAAAPRGGPASGEGWYTVLAQTNDVYQKAGIDSYAELEDKYSSLGNPVNPQDSLHLYVAYRILKGNKYLADIVSAAAHTTLAPQEVVTTKLKGDSVLINETVFNGVLEKGSPVNRALSDISANNGVLHSVMSDFSIKLRIPVRVYFDVADQPELRLLPSWRKPGTPDVILDAVQIAGVSTTGDSEIEYKKEGEGSGNPKAFYDYFEIEFAPNRVSSMTFKTPVLVKGVYKVWICYRRTSSDGTVQTLFNGEPLQNLLRYDEYWPGGGFTEEELLAQGWKRHMPIDGGNSQARLVGTIVVESTAQHEITLKSVVGGYMQLDMIQFIPVQEVQLWPKVAEDGSWVYPEE